MPTINDIKPRAFKSIPIKVYEEIKPFTVPEVSINGRPSIEMVFSGFGDGEVKWVDGTPYSITVV